MIGTSIYSLLSGHTPLTDIVGTNIDPVRAPQEKENPIVIYGIVNTDPNEVKTAVSSEDWIDIEIMIYSDDYDQGHVIAKECRNALDKKSGTIAGNDISDIIFQNFQDGWDDARECYASLMKFQLMSKP